MAEKRPFRIVLGEGPPKGTLGGSLSRYVPPGAQYDYKPPSVFERYKLLSITFALMVLALVLYLVLAPSRHHAPIAEPVAPAAPSSPTPTPTPGGAAAEPVYVVPLAAPKRAR